MVRAFRRATSLFRLGTARGCPLAELPPAELELTKRPGASAHEIAVTLHNPGPTLASFTRLRLLDADVVPAHYSDNYVSLVPGESLQLSVSARGPTAAVRVEATASGSPPAALWLNHRFSQYFQSIISWQQSGLGLRTDVRYTGARSDSVRFEPSCRPAVAFRRRFLTTKTPGREISERARDEMRRGDVRCFARGSLTVPNRAGYPEVFGNFMIFPLWAQLNPAAVAAGVTWRPSDSGFGVSSSACGRAGGNRDG